ncbi:VOC family protein [Nonomuraea solani]|nr:VOC family protein [Nonomuraea solani]
MRCDLGSVPADHHTLAMHLGPRVGYVHSAYQVTDLDAVAAGGQHLADQGYRRVWGIGRHIQGGRIFDYWRDPDEMMVEHYADGDLFDATLTPGWAPMSGSGENAVGQQGPAAGGEPMRHVTPRDQIVDPVGEAPFDVAGAAANRSGSASSIAPISVGGTPAVAAVALRHATT